MWSGESFYKIVNFTRKMDIIHAGNNYFYVNICKLILNVNDSHRSIKICNILDYDLY